jgi:hypothetical protein
MDESRYSSIMKRGNVSVTTSLLAVLVLLSGALTGALTGAVRASAASEPAPGGKTNFVVSVGGFAANTTTNWLRISEYTFDPAQGTVTGTWWRWNQTSMRDIRVDTPIAAAGCGPTQCYARTAKRYLSPPSESSTGTYHVVGDALAIRWPSGSSAVQENWTVTQVSKTDGSADTSLVQLVWAGAGAGYSATAGYGFGSNASFSVSASMAQLMQPENKVSYPYFYTGYHAGALTSGTSHLALWNFNACQDGRCLGATSRTKPGNGCTDYPPGDSAEMATINYYFAQFAGDRRNAYEHWFRCLGYRDNTGQTCYKLNSHVKPLIQVIDDAGRFRGWVGAETAYYSLHEGQSDGSPTQDALNIIMAGPRLLAP